MKKRKKIPVIYSKLGRQKAWGEADLDYIELDERLKGKKHLEIMLHELLHVIFPQDTENEIIKNSIILTNTLWADGYRKTDLSNDIPLQDGSK